MGEDGRSRVTVTTDADAAFDALQRRLVDHWPRISEWTDEPQTVVVLPSFPLDPELLRSVEVLLPAYEQRFLFLLFLLRQPRCRVVLLTSVPVEDWIIDAYLALVPGTDPEDARSRLVRIDAGDPGPEHLAAKLLRRPDLLAAIRAEVDDPERAHIVGFGVSSTERDLALALDLPVYGAAPRFEVLGSKSGCRSLFADVGVNHPAGARDLRGAKAVADALASLRRDRPDARAFVVKLDDGVSGMGNVVLRDVPAGPGAAAAAVAALDPTYLARLSGQGAVLEELIESPSIRSPSVQLRVTPAGEVQMLSTHDQILGGPEGQTYVGCRFPADPGYAVDIARDAEAVGRRLAGLGVWGRLAVDFVVARDGDGPWRSWAIEVNLRKGGTTHPFLTLQFLTDGVYQPADAAFVLPDGGVRAYVATDGLHVEGLGRVGGRGVLEAAAAAGLAYQPDRRAGVVFHMLPAVEAADKIGLTAIAGGRREADELYDEVVELLSRLC